MNAKPILFSGPMVRALLDGRKTQTRRVAHLTASGRLKAVGSSRNWHPHDEAARLACPHGQPGDLLWVRETFAMADPLFGTRPKVLYRADDGHKHMLWEVDRWRPSLFMPRRWSRLTLRITDVRVERVQEITAADCVTEGVGGVREQFRLLWDSLNASRGFGWDVNPWVWVIGFEVIQRNVDDVLREAC